MATNVGAIFRLESFYYNDCMSPTEYCNSLTFLPNEKPLRLDALNVWRGTPWGLTRSPVRPAVGRALHYGSTPDFDTDFTGTDGPSRPKNKCAVIGTGRPKPESPPSPSLKESGKDFTSTDITSIKLANTMPTEPKTSKCTKWIEASEPHGEAATSSRINESNHTVSVTNSPNTIQTSSKRDMIQSWRHMVEPHGGLSILPSDDRGMNATESDDSADDDATTSTKVSSKVTFDLGAQYAIGATAERKAKCRARAHEMTIEEGAACKRAHREADEDIFGLSSILTSIMLSLEEVSAAVKLIRQT